MITFSVIIPVYNREHFIGKTLSSVLAQTYRNFEIIIIDDGSSDHTRNVIHGFKDERIRYFYQTNQGVASARNRGIYEAKGDYITFLDSDDELDICYLESIVNRLQFCDADVCYAGMMKRNLETGKCKEWKTKFCSGYILYEYLKGYVNVTGINTFCVKTDFVKKHHIHFLEDVSFGEDEFFCMQVLTLGSVECIEKYLATYNYHLDSLTNDMKESFYAREKYFKVYFDWLNHQKVRYDKRKIKKLIFEYRMPMEYLRTYFDGVCREGKKYIQYKGEFKKRIKKFHLSIGCNKIKDLVYLLTFSIPYVDYLVAVVYSMTEGYRKRSL